MNQLPLKTVHNLEKIGALLMLSQRTWIVTAVDDKITIYRFLGTYLSNFLLNKIDVELLVRGFFVSTDYLNLVVI